MILLGLRIYFDGTKRRFGTRSRFSSNPRFGGRPRFSQRRNFGMSAGLVKASVRLGWVFSRENFL